ncbi:Uncharacterised protein [Halioglobus japonicus]|nr:Uncharacterised protein [Halioglobus japonicus]
MTKQSLSFVFGLSSLIGLVLTAIVTLYTVFASNYAASPNVLILSLAAVNIALGVVCVTLFQISERANKENLALTPVISALEGEKQGLLDRIQSIKDMNAEIANITHSIQDQLRDRIYELNAQHEASVTGEEISTLEQVDISRTNEMFYLFLVDNIKRIYDILTGENCAVCIKFLEEFEADNEIYLRTFMRDSGSYRIRKSSDRAIYSFPYHENTAFKQILSSDPSNTYYASDNLSNEQTYVNLNSNWRAHYNATLVCPIQIEVLIEDYDESIAREFDVLGFICIDNMNGGLSNPTAVNILAGIADSLYNHFLLYNSLLVTIVSSGKTDKGGNEQTGA